MLDLLLFRRMITPVIIQAVFWLGSLLCVASGAITMMGSLAALSGDLPPEARMMMGGGSLFAGLAMMLLGPLVLRIYCELLILFFRMNESLTDIRASLLHAGQKQGG